MRIVFMGTPDFAVPSLEALLAEGHEIAGVITQPDRPKGRGNKVLAPPVKLAAQKHGLPVFQPEKIRRDGVETLRSLAPELCVTAAFGQILSQELLDIPARGTVNVHASLLPRHRGAAPIAWAILQGDAELGVTTMLTARGLDNGDMLLRTAFPRDPALTCGEWTERLSRAGAELLLETLRQMETGRLVPEPQDEAQMSYEPMLSKAMSVMDWHQDAEALANRVMALNPWPACSVPFGEGRLKLLRAEPAEGRGEAGTVLAADVRSGLLIACGSGALRVTELQAPGGKAMRAADYLRGHSIPEGTDLKEDTNAPA